MRKKILVVAQTPPPMHGQAIMNQYFLAGDYQSIELHHVLMAFSDTVQEVGGFRWRKVIQLFVLLSQVVVARVRTGADVLYYPPASPNLVPFLRDVAFLIAARWMFRETVFHFHANGISGLYQRLPRFFQALYRRAYSNPEACICLTRFAMDDARHFGSRRIAIVPNGIPDTNIDLRLKHKNANSLPTILFLSTISLEKGVGVLIDAVGILNARGFRFSCSIAGPFASRQDEDTVATLLAKHGLGHIVTLRGEVSLDAKWNCFREADIFCFPTYYRAEGFPVVLLEAMMFGLPVVATNWRGIPDIVENGKTGFLVPIRDANALAERLEQLLKDREFCKAMGEAGRSRYEKDFTIEKFQRRMEEVLTCP